MDNVQGLIKQITGVDIFQETRKQEVVEYRAVANLFLNKILGCSLMDIVRWYQSNGKNSPSRHNHFQHKQLRHL
jgi:hypothetical protein